MKQIAALELVDTIRQPPYSKEAENNVLGALMLDNRVFDDIADVINENDFFHRTSRLIFKAIGILAQASQPFDVMTLSDWLEKRNELEEVGGLGYLGTLAKNTATVANAKAYANIVRNYSVERHLLVTANDIQSTVYGTGTTQEKLDHAQTSLLSVINNAVTKGETESTNQILMRVINQIDAAFHNKGQVPGLRTGFIDVDKVTSGLQNGDLIIIAGRPSMGKTALAMNIASHVVTQGDPVMVFSLEMPSDQLIKREISAIGGVDHAKLRSGQLGDEDWPKVTYATSVLSNDKLIIDGCKSLGLLELKARARREMRKQKLKLIVVDYLQLMRISGDRNRNEEIGDLSRGLKQLAMELNIPVIVLSQLNRSLEKRPNKRPIMSDLRDSGEIEQDAM